MIVFSLLGLSVQKNILGRSAWLCFQVDLVGKDKRMTKSLAVCLCKGAGVEAGLQLY